MNQKRKKEEEDGGEGGEGCQYWMERWLLLPI